jgi:hypothetical protein
MSAAAYREWGKRGGDLPMDRKPVARTKCMGKVPFIATWVEGGWDGRDGSALTASARPCSVSSTRTHGCIQRSEWLL